MDCGMATGTPAGALAQILAMRLKPDIYLTAGSMLPLRMTFQA